jgi:hypothetical protein
MVYGSWTNELMYTNKYMGIMLQTINMKIDVCIARCIVYNDVYINRILHK